jgi:hypothetical protein
LGQNVSWSWLKRHEFSNNKLFAKSRGLFHVHIQKALHVTMDPGDCGGSKKFKPNQLAEEYHRLLQNVKSKFKSDK